MALEMRKLGRTGLNVSFIGFGALEIGRNWGIGNEAERQKPEEAEAGRVLNGVLDLGINLIDTARAYHFSEERIGKSVAHRREEYVLTSKCGEHTGPHESCYYDFSYKAISESIDLSLRLLNTNVIDVMQIHFGPDPAEVLDDGETVRAMLDAREAGKIRFLGASPNEPWITARCIDMGVFDVLQINYSLVDRSHEREIARAGEKGIGVLVRGGFGAGLLTPRVLKKPEALEQVKPFLDQVDGDVERLPMLALQFLKQNPAVSSVLVGTKSLEHMRANVAAAAQLG